MKKLILAVLITVCLAGCQSQSGTERLNSENPENVNPSVYDLRDLDKVPTVIGIQAQPVYPLEMKRRGITGQVMLQFVVTSHGDVRDIKVISSTNKAFEEPAIQAAQQWKFRPGSKRGRAVNTLMRLPISFDLQDI